MSLLAVLAMACLAPDAEALVSAQALQDLTVTVYAPDWTWQKRDINMLVVVRNEGPDAEVVSLGLVLPEVLEDHFRFKGEAKASVEVPPGEVVRYAFTDITALDGVPRQRYTFALEARTDDAAISMAYPVRTIRGAAVSPGEWATFLPVGIAAVWCLVFLLGLRRFASPGAWHTPSAPIREPVHPESWIARRP